MKFTTLAIPLLLIATLLAPNGIAQDAPAPVTITRPKIPLDQLKLRLTPLRQAQLEIECEAWLELLQEKVQELSEAELSVRQTNAERAVAEKTAAAMDDAKEAIEKAEASGDERAQARAEQAVQTAQEKVEQEAEVVQEAAGDASDTAATPAPTPAPEIGTDATAIGEQADALKESIAEKVEAKGTLLEQVTLLRDEKTALVDRANLVVDAFERKGGDPAEYRTYIAAVSGVSVDVSDWESLGAVVTGWFTSTNGGIRWAGNIVSFFSILLVFWILSKVAARAVKRAIRMSRNMSRLLRDFIENSVRRVVLVIGVVVSASALEIDVGPALAVIGAAGFVIAFALQGTLSNFASGIMILLYRPFDVGHFIDAGGVAGTVHSLNLVSTTIHTPDNKTIIVPNNAIWGNTITNVTGSKTRRVDLVFGIGYNDDIEKAKAILARIVAQHPKTLDDPEPVIRVNELADSSVNFICRPWVLTGDYWGVYWDLTQQVKEQFDAEGVSIPFPQRDIHVYQTAEKGAVL